MATELKKYFPAIRERKELLEEIAENEVLSKKFDSWEKEQQEDFLNICTGVS